MKNENNKFLLSTLILFCLQVPLLAHENWIELTKSKESNTKINILVKIGSGHSFPESVFALEDSVVNYCRVIMPNGKMENIVTNQKGNFRLGDIGSVKKGAYIVLSGLKNPPRYFLKSIITIGKCSKTDFNTGEPFEIVPGECPSGLNRGDRLKLRIILEGEPVQTQLSFSINGENNFSTSTNRKGEYELNIRKSGHYLVTSSIKGKTCSLTFTIE